MGARRAGVTALAVVVVTAGLAVLLAVVFGLAWPPVVVAIVGTLPTLYLAWAALPGALKKPGYGRRVGRWDPVELGVHQVIGGGPMPSYVRRPHDELLRAVLDPAVAGSRLVVVRGGSSTGKTRAAYEAVSGRLAGWQLDYPLDPGTLAARLEAGIPVGTVLWLGELRQYADADGGAAALGRLADLLGGEGHLVITTVWPEQWTTYTAAARAGPGAANPAGTAGRLLGRLPDLTGADPARVDPARGGVIDVPDQFTAADLDAAARAGDPLLAEAAAAAAGAGQSGQVTQYLAGVPSLLDRYAGPGGDPYGQAVITAAMDAARLGHASPLPAALVQEAAVGYLTGPQRTKDIAAWRDAALAWAAAELNGAVRALRPIPPQDGTGVAGYQVADYLDQHARRTRRDLPGPPSLWDALTTHATTTRDLIRLGQAAQDRGLYRYAAALWTRAVTARSLHAAGQLIDLLRQVSPGEVHRAADWAAGYVGLEPYYILRMLPGPMLDSAALTRFRGSSRLARERARKPAPDDTHARKPAPDDTHARKPAAAIRTPGIQQLLYARQAEVIRGAAGASNAVRALATQLVSQASLDNPWEVVSLLQALHGAWSSDAVTTLLARDPANHACLDDPRAVAALLHELREAGASDAVTTLLARDPANHIRLDHPQAVAALLHELREAGASDAATTLLARDPANHARLDDPQAVAALLEELREAGASDAATALASRAANAGMFDLFLKVRPDQAPSYRFGREPDGTPSQTWKWQEPGQPEPGPRIRQLDA